MLELFLPEHQATLRLGRAIAKCVRGGAVLALKGDLGAGKTTLVQGIGDGLGIKEAITSPTFTMLNEYHTGRLPLYHLDLYRVAQTSDAISLEMLAFEIDELIYQKGTSELSGVTVIEWAELFVLDESGSNYLNECDHLTVSLLRGNRGRKSTGEGLTFNTARTDTAAHMDTAVRISNNISNNARAGDNACATNGRVDITRTGDARVEISENGVTGSDLPTLNDEVEPGRVVSIKSSGPKSDALLVEVSQEVTDMLIYS